MTTAGTPPPANVGRRKRSDARRNQQALLDAAATVLSARGSTLPCGTSPPRRASAWAPSTGIPYPGRPGGCGLPAPTRRARRRRDH